MAAAQSEGHLASRGLAIDGQHSQSHRERQNDLTRGATTICEQLANHRKVESCDSCHKKIDPPGFALESFDVIGG